MLRDEKELNDNRRLRVRANTKSIRSSLSCSTPQKRRRTAETTNFRFSETSQATEQNGGSFQNRTTRHVYPSHTDRLWGQIVDRAMTIDHIKPTRCLLEKRNRILLPLFSKIEPGWSERDF